MRLTFKNIIKIIIILILIFYLIVPSDFYSLYPLYKITTYNSIEYKWVDYTFSVFLLPIIAVGTICSIYKKNFIFFGITTIILLIEFLRMNLSIINIFSLQSYEGILPLITAFSMIGILICIFNKKNIERFFVVFSLLHILLQFFNVITGNDVDGRYNTSNLNFEGTALIASLFCIYCISNNIKYKWIFASIASISVLLSGSRICLALLICVILINYVFDKIKIKKTIKKKTVLTILFFLLIGVCGGILILSDIITIPQGEFERIKALFSISGIMGDSSSMGRMESLRTGIELLSNNKLGISFSPTYLQYMTNLLGYPTFPHSFLLCFFIMLGPTFVVFFVFIIGKIVAYGKQNSNIYMLIYLFLFLTITGGITTNFKDYFIWIYVIILVIPDKEKRKNLENIRRINDYNRNPF